MSNVGRKLTIGGGFMPMISHYCQMIPYDDTRAIVWHSIFGRPMLVTNALANFLKSYAQNGHSFAYEDLFGNNYEKDKDAVDTIVALSDAYILLTEWQVLNERESRDITRAYFKHHPKDVNKVKYLSLIMSEECQFRCKYCIHFANAEHQYNPERMMSLEVAESSVDYYLESAKANGLDTAYINFGGGEPLLNWKTLEQLLPYIKMRSKKIGIPVKLGLNTNMALLTKSIAKTLIDYNVEIAASLDGTRAGNDSVRLTKSRGGTYGQIIRGFNIMRDLGHPLNGFAMTVTEDNFADVDTPLIDWAASLGMTEIRIDIDIVGAVNLPILSIVSCFMEVRKYARSKGISIIGFWSRPAENLGLTPEEADIGFCGAERGNSLCVAPSGQLFPCGYSNYQLGSYTDIPTIWRRLSYRKLLASRSLDKLKKICDISCPIIGFCRGGCMITREASRANPGKTSRMCEFYQAMTYEILRESVAAELST